VVDVDLDSLPGRLVVLARLDRSRAVPVLDGFSPLLG
jgi:hypothetical protein